jgi:hypothetical protein
MPNKPRLNPRRQAANRFAARGENSARWGFTDLPGSSSTSATRQLGVNEFLGRRAVAGVRHETRNVIGGYLCHGITPTT